MPPSPRTMQTSPRMKSTTCMPLWTGPGGDGPNGGVTQGLISGFLTCRERFRIKVIDGWRPADRFSHRLEYGNMWHLCEEFTAQGQAWEGALQAAARDLCRRYPLEQNEVNKWYNVCKVQYPVYLDYWERHQDQLQREPLLQEYKFDVDYRLPNGRAVRLRGKLDAVDLIGTGKGRGVYLFETKTKGDVDETRMKRQLLWDLQTMMYLTALHCLREGAPGTATENLQGAQGAPILGVRYNVIRRPLSGGKGTIVRHKPTKSNPKGETAEEYYARLQGIIKDDPGHYFMRWRAEVGRHDVDNFRRCTLDPILEQMAAWYETVTTSQSHGDNDVVPDLKCHDPVDVNDAAGVSIPAWAMNWRHPYGSENMIDEGYDSDVEHMLETGSSLGLARTNVLFPELA